MPDRGAGEPCGGINVSRPSRTGSRPETGPFGSALSLLIVALVGEPTWFRPVFGPLGWLPRARAAMRSLFRVRTEIIGTGVRPPAGDTDRWPADRATPMQFASAFVLVAAATAIGLILQRFLSAGSLLLPFLIAILLTAVAYGLLASLAASVLSVVTYDFLFLPPLYSLTVSNPDDVLRLAIFALTALIVSNLAAYARRQAIIAGQRAKLTEELYQFSRQLTGAATLREVLAAATPRLTAMVRARVRIVLLADGDLAVYPSGAPISVADDIDVAGTEFAELKSWLMDDSTSRPPAPESARWLFVPIWPGRGKVGVLAIARGDLAAHRVPNSAALFGTLADLLAQAIDRINLVDDLNEIGRAAEREALHAALLASLSHDLRTPLASVLGNAEAIIARGDTLSTGLRRDLALSIQEDARRLDRYIGNLLDMTRLEAGLAAATAGRIDLTDVVSAALARSAGALSSHRLHVAIESDLPLLAGDEVLLEHVLFNLLDNAAKYAPTGSSIEFRAFRAHFRVAIEVSDEGEGIPAADLERIFEKFFRARPGGIGIGLGLAICRGYVQAMGGRICARNRTDSSGAIFTITLPVPAGEEQVA